MIKLKLLKLLLIFGELSEKYGAGHFNSSMGVDFCGILSFKFLGAGFMFLSYH